MPLPLRTKITRRENLRVAVLGVGYVGLPLAVRLAEAGLVVIGLDINRQVIKQLEAGISTVEGLSSERLSNCVGKSLQVVTVNKNPAKTPQNVLRKLSGIDIYLICVPTPLDKRREWEPDTSFIESACQTIDRVCEFERKKHKLPRERLVVLESTTYPGTTEEIFGSLIEKYRTTTRRWYLAYSPERTNPGQYAYEKNAEAKEYSVSEELIPPTFDIPKIVGGYDRPSKEICRAFYQIAFKNVIGVRNLKTAELVKLVENTFRFTSVAFANEMARVAKTLGLNVWEVIDAAKTKKFGFNLCYPGLIGGHCLPIDPHYLSSAVRSRRIASTFVDVAESEHQNMRREAFDLIQRLINQHNRGVSGSSILFFGVSYKKGVGDIRESAAIRLMQRLYASGAKVTFWDPVRASHKAKSCPRLVYSKAEYKELPKKLAARLKWDSNTERYFVEPRQIKGSWPRLKTQVLRGTFQCVVIATDHDDFRPAYHDLIDTNNSPPIVDLCNSIGWWLRDTDLPKKEKARLRNKLSDKARYMLLGVH